MSLEQKYYEMLTRTDHPVFRRDFSDTTTADSPLNSILNRVLAKQLVKLNETMLEIEANAFPNLVTQLGIDQWEETYFGFKKFSKTLPERVAELLIKINKRFSMSVPDVVTLSIAITGVEPIVIRSFAYDGWTLGESALEESTILRGAASAANVHTYLVIFPESVDPGLLAQLDRELTKIEKGGSIHILSAPDRFWLLGEGSFGDDTLMR